MSVYYDFYIGIKNNKTGLINPNVIMWKNEKPLCFYYRSGSFFNREVIYDMTPINKKNVAEEDKKFFFYEEDDNRSNSYYIPLKNVSILNKGLVTGYVKLEDYIALTYDDSLSTEDMIDELSIIKPEIVAEMSAEERQKYIKFSAIDTRKLSYIGNLADEILYSHDFKLNEDEEFVLICSID